ncbi:unnamed protein product, partial [marine sediment metagenome]
MANFWDSLGDTFSGINAGVVGIVGGVAAQIGSGAQLTSAQAAMLNAQAQNYGETLKSQERERDAQRNQLYIVFALVFLAPILA